MRKAAVAGMLMSTAIVQPHVCHVCRVLHAVRRTSTFSSRCHHLPRRGTRIRFGNRRHGHASVCSRDRPRLRSVARHIQQRPFLWVNHKDVQTAILRIFHRMESQQNGDPAVRSRRFVVSVFALTSISSEILATDVLVFFAGVVEVLLPVARSDFRLSR